MLTSRGTSLKALRLNKSVLFTVFTFLLASGVVGTAGFGVLSAQEQEQELGVLLKGPLIRKGIPFLYPNAIPVFYGEYEYQNKKIIIYFTEEEIVRSDSWAPFECPERILYRIKREERLVLYFRDENEWSVFFSMHSELETPCRFIDKFLERFLYFRTIARGESIATFPAVLEF